MTQKKLLSTTEVAQLFGISRVAVFKKIKKGQIKATKVGHNYVIRKKDLADIFGEELSLQRKKEIEKAVNKVVKEYGETLRLLGQE